MHSDDELGPMNAPDASFENEFGQALNAASEEIVKAWKEQLSSILEEMHEAQQEFESNLAERWGKALDLYELVWAVASELGAEFNSMHSADAAKEDDTVFAALVNLHARACRVAAEVYTLLRSGFPAGAHARWRTLHEISVLAHVIAEGGRDIAERYFAHRVVQSAKDMREYNRHCRTLGYEPFTDEEVEEQHRQAAEIKTKYGEREFERPYAWASPLFGGRAPRFDELEERAGLSHLRPFYSWASHDIHATSKGTGLNLLQRGGGHILLAGAVNMGLADPAHSAMISLAQITVNLLIMGRPEPTPEFVAYASAILQLQDEAGATFLEAHQRLEADDKAIWAANPRWRCTKCEAGPFDYAESLVHRSETGHDVEFASNDSEVNSEE
jgi:Family of unknown function (DUF5677)